MPDIGVAIGEKFVRQHEGLLGEFEGASRFAPRCAIESDVFFSVPRALFEKFSVYMAAAYLFSLGKLAQKTPSVDKICALMSRIHESKELSE